MSPHMCLGMFAVCLGACSDHDGQGSTGASEAATTTGGDTGDGPSSTRHTTDDTGETSTGAHSTTSTASATGTDPTTGTNPTTGTDPTTTDPGTMTTAVNTCGDGVVDPGEVCDDGTNDGAYGGCMPDCGAPGPACGDAVVNGPEACDDGTNDGMYGGCMPDCGAPGPGCGDGILNGPEVCDDGTNDGGYDGCLPDCSAPGPSCGDGIVNGREGCDDGVNSGYGSCLADCSASGPHCGDGEVEVGEETCDDQNSDSADGCLATCQVPLSCLEILGFDPAAKDGVYGLGVMNTTWKAYCDMKSDGGGWTLAAKVEPVPQWLYNASRWVDNSTLNPAQAGYDHMTAKLDTWNHVPFTAVRVGMEPYVMGNVMPPAPTYVKIEFAMQQASLFAVFSPNKYVPTTIGKPAWSTLVPMASLQSGCNKEGFNTTVDNGQATARIRLGIVGSNQADCSSPNSGIGLGLGNFAGACMPDPSVCIGNLNCDPNINPKVKKLSFGWVFVR